MLDNLENSEIYQKETYKDAVIVSNRAFIAFLLIEQINFTIIVHTHAIEFEPVVPKSVINFDKLVRLDIANYTLETAKLMNNTLILQTAFGIENFESTLKIPLEAIFQIAINQDLIALNYYEPQEKEIDSLDVFLSNPANLELLKRKKR
jgi:hypothetical protein